MNPPSTLNPSTVLLIEDNPADARLLKELVSEVPGAAFTLINCPLLEEGLARLEKEDIDLVMVDLSLPDSHGLVTFEKVQKAAPQLPIIVMSGLNDENLAIKTVQEGAQDYLVKGQVDSRLLVRSMNYAIERKRVEEDLAKERDLFHTLLDNLPDRIYFKDNNSRFLRISKALAKLFKLDHPREAWMKSDLDFFSREHAEEALADERRVMETGEPILGKVEREPKPDGSHTWALTSKLPLRDKHGAIIGSFGISRDITEIKHIEDQLASERNLLRSLIDNLPDFIYVKDTQGRYVINNASHQRFLGANSLEEVIGKRAEDFFPKEVAETFDNDDQTIFKSGHPVLNREAQIMDRCGQLRWHGTTKVPLRNHRGIIVGLVGIARDITDNKMAEEQLRKTHTDLKHSHEELKSAQFQLIQAEKMQSIGRLAAGVAHEVKNPLAILRMGIDYFSGNMPKGDENTSLIVKDMKEAIKRADMIILGLLDFSVPAALEVQPHNLNAIVEQSIRLVRHEMASPKIKLVQNLAPNMPEVMLDPNKIKQVLVNLMTNAIHAMPDGGTLTLRSWNHRVKEGEFEKDAGSRLLDRFRTGDHVAILEVMDSGTGVSEEKLSKIFDPFFTTKPTGKGTGLGLTVTKKIIEMHGGSIEIDNRKEGGARVTIVFKL